MRACVVGKRVKTNFVDMDEVLVRLVHAHQGFVRDRQKKAHRVFGKFDINGDGVFDKGEFVAMMRAIDPEAKMKEIDELWVTAGGKGTDDKSTLNFGVLEEKLFTIGRLHKAATAKQTAGRHGRPNLVQSAAAQGAREELSVLVALWDSVRNAPESAEEKERHEQVNNLLKNNWASVMRMKAWLRLRLERWRQKAHEHQQLRGPK